MMWNSRFSKSVLKLILKILCVVSFVSSCAYFNTFHNTKKLFKEARKEREKRQDDQPTAAEVKFYDQTIEKASKILEIYPDSKYVDDAVMILGECFYYKKEFVKAQRKFQELINYFPESEYYYSAKIWLARTNIKLNDYLSARLLLVELLDTEKIKRELRDEARFLLGEILYEQQTYEDAAKEYATTAETAGDDLIKSRAYYQLGECQIRRENYSEAVKSFKKAFEHSPNRQLKFDSRLNYAKSLKLAGHFQDATKVLSELLEDQSFKDKHGYVRLEMADCIYREGKALYKQRDDADLPAWGKIEEALEEYKLIALENKRTEASAVAYYRIAEIYENDFGNFAAAQENYEKVRVEYNRAEFTEQATQKAKDLADLIRLSNLVKKAQGEQLIDGTTGQHRMTELELLLHEQGNYPELEFMKKRRALQLAQGEGSSLGNGVAVEEGVDNVLINKLQLAETYLFQFAQVDSALREYREIIELFPEHPKSAKALYSSAFIYENVYQDKFKTDSLLYAVIKKFPDSQQAQDARKKLGLPLKFSKSEQISDQYREAERTLFRENNVSRAIEKYRSIVDNYPDSEYAPKALLALGWIEEKLRRNNQKAREIYQEVLDRYPNSEYSEKVNKKLMAAVDKTTETPPDSVLKQPETVEEERLPETKDIETKDTPDQPIQTNGTEEKNEAKEPIP